MAKKSTTKIEATEIAAKCDYCKHNEGENKQFGFMWKCSQLGYCVPFGYGIKYTKETALRHCKASVKEKGSFAFDRIKYEEYIKNNK